MGIFSRKTRHYGGVTNSRLYKDSEFPRSIKDSTASFIKDQASMVNTSEVSLVDYNTMGIEQSIVPKFKKTARYVQSPEYKTASNYKTQAILEGDISSVRGAIEAEMRREIGSTLKINYLLIESVDYAHLVRQILIDDYAYSPVSNSLTIAGQDYWLSDAILYLFERQSVKPIGYSFMAPPVPGRDKDTTRPYTPWVYAEDIPKVPKRNPNTGQTEMVYPQAYYDFEEKAELYLIEKYTHEYYEEVDTVTTTVDGVETVEVLDPVITDIYNNKPTTGNLTEYRKVLEEETSKVIEDTPERKVVRVTKKYDSSFYPDSLTRTVKDIKLATYFSTLPSIPEMGEWHEGTDDQDVEDYIEDFESGAIKGDIFGSSYIISISFSYVNSDGERVESYRTLVDKKKPNTSLGNILKRYDNIIADSISLVDVGFYMPELFYRNFNKDINQTNMPLAYEYYKAYSKKLGIDYDTFIEQLYDGMIEDAEDGGDVRKVKDNWSKVRSVAIVFGIKADTDDPLLLPYLFEFFRLHVPKSTGLNPAKVITIEDSYSEDEYRWDMSYRRIIDKVIMKEGEVFKKDTYYANKRINKDISFYKQISPTQCEVVLVENYKRNIKVVSEKWIQGNSSEDKDADTLVPLSPGLLFRVYRKFKDKEAVIYKSIYVEFISYVKQKDKWYQGGLGKILGFAVGAIVSLVFPPAFLAGAALTTAASIGISTLVGTALSLGVSSALKVVVKAFGIENSRIAAIILGVAAIAFGAYSAMGNLVTLMKSLTVFFNKITVYMIQAAKGLLNEINVVIGVEYEGEAKAQKEKLKALETHAENMFGYLVDDSGDYGSNRNYISPLINIGMGIDQIMAEATNYNRMSECIDYNHNYVDYILSLPTLEETIQSMHSDKD